MPVLRHVGFRQSVTGINRITHVYTYGHTRTYVCPNREQCRLCLTRRGLHVSALKDRRKETCTRIQLSPAYAVELPKMHVYRIKKEIKRTQYGTFSDLEEMFLFKDVNICALLSHVDTYPFTSADRQDGGAETLATASTCSPVEYK